jgi:hypothetical protein
VIHSISLFAFISGILTRTQIDELALLPVKTLEKHRTSIKEETANASALLTWLLQCRDILQQDSETYNGLIAELVGEAQKIKTGKARNPIRRGTGG